MRQPALGAHMANHVQAKQSKRRPDDGAYYISFEPMRGGGTSVDLIVNGGF